MRVCDSVSECFLGGRRGAAIAGVEGGAPGGRGRGGGVNGWKRGHRGNPHCRAEVEGVCVFVVGIVSKQQSAWVVKRRGARIAL